MEQVLADIASAFQEPLYASLGAVFDVMFPLYSAVMVAIISAAALNAAFGSGTYLTATYATLINIIGAGAILQYLPDLVAWSIGQAQQLTTLGGGGGISTPYEIAAAGGRLFQRAYEHSDAAWTTMPGVGWVISVIILLVGIALLAAYGWLVLVSLSAFTELLIGAVVLAPLTALLAAPGFQQAGFQPIGHLASGTLRIAGLGFIASFGTAFIEEHALPPTSEPITWTHCAIGIAVAFALWIITLAASKIISAVLIGRGTGWDGASAAFSAARGAVSTAVAGVSGGSGAAASMAASRAAGGSTGGRSGGGTGGGGGGGGGGSVGSTSTPVNSRQARK